MFGKGRKHDFLQKKSLFNGKESLFNGMKNDNF